MKKIIMFLILALFLVPCLAFAEYSENISKGKTAYMAGNYDDALTYYKAAFSENPTMEIGNFIVQLEAMSKKAKNIQQAQAVVTPEPSKSNISPGSVLLIIADIALIGTAIYAYADYNAAADSYDTDYLAIDNTNMANYNKLSVEMDNVKSKETFMGIFAGIAGAAALYTLADAVFIHAAFPVKVSAGFTPGGAKINLAFNKEF
jgi:tetratricopeptide (TPR) repeat protein